MDREQFAKALADKDERTRRYGDLVALHYDRAADYFHSGWGDSFHFTWYQGDEPRQVAQARQQHRLADLGRFSAGAAVADIGCGAGGPDAAVARHSGARVTGVDLSPRHIALAQRLHAGLPTLRFQVGDAMQLPFPCAAFDGAFSIEALCHTPDKAKAHGAVARILRPGASWVGYDWFTTHTADTAAYRDRVEPLCRQFVLPNLLALDDLPRTLEHSGFRTEGVGSYADLGDLTRNWTEYEPPRTGRDRTPLDRQLHESLSLLRAAVEHGDFVFGWWQAVRH
ncbi:SAM-dependent methyltransferase [Streptomyces sp. NPDC059003]|uniref:SAM-dependent methyltransferase n=1 Tax=Streptomyces sp. NPDC059003 TaxID=3346691 RepID=UPI00369EBF3E